MLVARREQENPRPAKGVAQRMERGRAAAARAADGLLEGPPFPPAAERCALTWELSMAAVPITAAVPVTASNIRQPNALPAPAVEPVVDGRVGAVLGRAITPAPSRPQHVQDAADYPPIVDPMRSAVSARQQRLNASPFRLAYPIKLLRHPSLHRLEA